MTLNHDRNNAFGTHPIHFVLRPAMMNNHNGPTQFQGENNICLHPKNKNRFSDLKLCIYWIRRKAILWLLTLHFWGFGPTLNAIIYISLISFFTVVASYLDLTQHKKEKNLYACSKNVTWVTSIFSYLHTCMINFWIFVVVLRKIWVYNATTVKYTSKEIMDLRVDPIPKNVMKRE